MNKKNLWTSVFIMLVLSLFSVQCQRGEDAAAQERRRAAFDRSKITFPVEVEAVKESSLVYTVNAVGSVEAFEKVQVTARVSGVVDRVLFS